MRLASYRDLYYTSKVSMNELTKETSVPIFSGDTVSNYYDIKEATNSLDFFEYVKKRGDKEKQ